MPPSLTESRYPDNLEVQLSDRWLHPSLPGQLPYAREALSPLEVTAERSVLHKKLNFARGAQVDRHSRASARAGCAAQREKNVLGWYCICHLLGYRIPRLTRA